MVPSFRVFIPVYPSIHEISGLGHETIVPWLTNWPPPLNQGALSIKDGTLSGMVNLARAKDMAFGVVSPPFGRFIRPPRFTGVSEHALPHALTMVAWCTTAAGAAKRGRGSPRF